MRVLTATGAALCLSVGLASAQAQEGEYLNAIEAYRRGHVVDGVGIVVSWSDDRIRSASRRVDRSADPALIKTIAMLHTEAAFALWPDRRMDRHVDAARHLVGSLGDRASGFTARWRVLAATWAVMRDQLNTARLELTHALDVGADSRYAELMLAALQELRIRRTRGTNLRDAWSAPVLEREMNALVAAYGRVVEAHPDFLAARLRLGWALFVNRSSSGREHLEYVASRATRPELRYLANLFLGAVAEREKRLDDALRAYEAARASLTHQSALLGIVATAGALGDSARVQRAAGALAALTAKAGADPWADYNLGLTGDEVLDALRTEARSR